jgi:hypothetical protein
MKTPDHSLYDPEAETRSSYSRALADAGGHVPYEGVDWNAFHVKLAARAELSLARLRYPHLVLRPAVRTATPRDLGLPAALTWWQYTARWSRLIVSASIAAGIALIIVVRASPKETADAIVASVVPATEPFDRTRAVFESAALGRGTRWTIESALLPTTAELLIPLGRGAASQ